MGSSRAKNPDSATARPASLGDGVEVLGLGELSRELGRDALGLLLRPLGLEDFLDLHARLVERAGRGGFLVRHADDVVTELRLHEVARFAGLEGERHVIELLDHGALAEEVEVAALGRADFVLGELGRERREVGPALDLGERLLGLLLHHRVVFALGLEEDVAGAHLLGRRGPLLVVVVVALHVGRRDRGALTDCLQVDERVLDLPLLGDLVGVLAGLEMRRDFGVGHGDRVLELVGGKRHYRELDLLVAAVELVGDGAVGDRDPIGERTLELLEKHAAPDLFFELTGIDRRVLHLQQLAIALVADEVSVLLERRQRENARAHFSVARGDALAPRFGQRRLFFDELLNDPLIDAELLEQALVHAAAVGVAIRLHLLLVDAAEAGDGDVLALDRRDHAVRAGAIERRALHEAGDVQGNERHDHNRQAPLEPVLVSAHPIEHRHFAAGLILGGEKP